MAGHPVDTEFAALRAEAHRVFKLHQAGGATRDEWLEKATLACEHYNRVARETAKKFGIRPRLLKPENFKK